MTWWTVRLSVVATAEDDTPTIARQDPTTTPMTIVVTVEARTGQDAIEVAGHAVGKLLQDELAGDIPRDRGPSSG